MKVDVRTLQRQARTASELYERRGGDWSSGEREDWEGVAALLRLMADATARMSVEIADVVLVAVHERTSDREDAAA